MNNEKDIQKHIDELMAFAHSPKRITTSNDFLDTLNGKLDEMDSTPKTAPIYSIANILKYAAIIAITFLNVGVVYTQLSSSETEETADMFTEVTDEYFPEYSSITE